MLLKFGSFLALLISLGFNGAYALPGNSPQAGDVWYLELDPPIILAPPVCKKFEGFSQKQSLYKLCLPSASAGTVKISASGSSVVLKGPGLIQGPILVQSKPPLILIGSMQINKGSVQLSVTKGAGFTMQGIGGAFEIEGFIVPLAAAKPLQLSEIRLEFTSPEDALLQLAASGQKAGVVLSVAEDGNGGLIFTPSPNNFSIFPKNAFFNEFKGEFRGINSARRLSLKLEDGKKINLAKQESE